MELSSREEFVHWKVSKRDSATFWKCRECLVVFPVSFMLVIYLKRRSQWPRGLRRRSAAAHLLRAWVRIPPGAWMFFCCECCVLSGRGLCDELITRPDESYRLWCVVVCDPETSRMRRPWPALGRSATKKKPEIHLCLCISLEYLRVFCLFPANLFYLSGTPSCFLEMSVSCTPYTVQTVCINLARTL